MDLFYRICRREYRGDSKAERKEGSYDQAVGSGMESDECTVGGGATDDYAVDTLFSGYYGLDEAHNYDFSETDGRERRCPL